MLDRIFHSSYFKIIIVLTLSTLALNGPLAAISNGLAIQKNGDNRPILTYNGKAVLAFGPSPQNLLTYLPKGNGNDFRDWIKWAQKYKINHVRSYPPSMKVDEPSLNIFKRSAENSDKFDLRLFNNAYFDELRKACKIFKEHGFIVHLQLWQAVHWKKAWGRSYYNLKNNVNLDISAHAGPGEFVTMKNKALLDHQKIYVKKILDATGDLGNVFYDIMNEIGNGTGKSEKWVWQMINSINEWEVQNGYDVLITLNDEGGRRMGDFSLKFPGLDLIVKDFGRYDEHVESQTEYGKPSISVRNIDYDYEIENRLYFFGKYNLEVNTDASLQTRGRKYWWRMFMAGVQIAGGYADAHQEEGMKWFLNRIFNKFGLNPIFKLNYKSSYRVNTDSETNFSKFRNFVDKLKYYDTLIPSTNVLSGHPVKNSYILQSNVQAIIYLESPNGRSGYNYKKQLANFKNLSLSDGNYNGQFYFPENGRTEDFSIQIIANKGRISLPNFGDDLAIFISKN